MLEIKLTHFPSGEKLGELALPTRAIRATAAATSCFFVLVRLLPGLTCHRRSHAAEQHNKN